MPRDSPDSPSDMTVVETLLYRAFGRPTGLLGRLGGWLMAGPGGKRKMTEWVLDLLSIQPTDRILEVGFGPGDGVQLASQAAFEGFVAGIDYSRQMVETARKRNAGAVEQGAVGFQYGHSGALPFDDGSFQKAFSINSMQVWPDAQTGLEELRRVLVPGGTVALAFTPHANQPSDELPELLSAAGFESVELHESDPGVCAIAHKQ